MKVDLTMDIKLGWKPSSLKEPSGAPIPLLYDFDRV